MPTAIESAEELITLCDAVVDLLNAGEFSQQFTAVRYKTARQALADVGTLRIAVVPESIEKKQIARRAYQLTLGVSVCVIKRIDPQTMDGSDELLKLARELQDYVDDNPISCDLNVRLTGSKIHVPYSPEHVQNLHVFLCPLSLPFLLYQ